jgi:lantibiotic modifying enzyme
MNNIIDRIEKHVWDSAQSENRIGLHDGLSGIALFYKYLYSLNLERKYQTKLISTIERINSLMAENAFNASLCTGIGGYGYLLTTLQEDSIDIGDDYFDSLDNLLSKELIFHSEKNDYDFLHGALGMAMYFIERYNSTKKEEVESILVQFTKILLSRIDKNIENIFIVNEQQNVRSLYFGIAHGISGYLNFLVYLKKSLKGKIINVDTYLDKITAFMYRYRQKDFSLGSIHMYPNFIDIDNGNIKDARLGWCQGDLCIGNSIYNTGLFLKNKTLLNEGIHLINNTKQISFIDSGVKDFAICHGSSGIILQYYLRKTKSEDYSFEIKHWYNILTNQTSDFQKFESFCDNDNKYINEINLLNGSAGLGLVLLTMDNKIDTDWTRCINLH